MKTVAALLLVAVVGASVLAGCNHHQHRRSPHYDHRGDNYSQYRKKKPKKASKAFRKPRKVRAPGFGY